MSNEINDKLPNGANIDVIDDRIASLIAKFKTFDSWDDRYKEIINLGKKLPAYDMNNLDSKFIVKGCQSQVFLIPTFESGKIFFQVESDALIVKGILAILVNVYSNRTPQEILKIPPKFLETMGIVEHLSMTRSNGLKSMIKQIQLYAFAYSQL
jgi:cysteine desulfuration protein SufE